MSVGFSSTKRRTCGETADVASSVPHPVSAPCSSRRPESSKRPFLETCSHISFMQSSKFVLSMDPITNSSAASASASAATSGVCTGGGSSPVPGKIRSACNRCHEMKLRCVRKTDRPGCERCLKLKRSCRFGLRASRATTRLLAQAEVRSQDDWHAPNVQPFAMDSSASNSDWTFQQSPVVGTAEEQG